MAIVNASAANAALGASGVGWSVHAALSIDVDFDFLVFDGTEPITYKHAPESSTVVDGRLLPSAAATVVPVQHALRHSISLRVVDGSGGRFRVGDVAFEIPAVELGTLTPRVGDKITTSDGSTWNVLGVELATFRSRWRIVARNG